MPPAEKISSDTVRADFNDPLTVVHYARAAHFLGLWKSEAVLIERFFTDKDARLIEAGCGAGRVTLGLWHAGYQNITAFDFAAELVDQARDLARQRDASAIRILHADATRLRQSLPGICRLTGDKHPVARGEAAAETCHLLGDKPPAISNNRRGPAADDGRPGGDAGRNGCGGLPEDSGAAAPLPPFDGALFMFNGLMQIPGRGNRRAALRELHAVCRPGAPFLFTTHDRDCSPTERALWRLEAQRWEAGRQDSRLVEFGDRYFEDETGRTFMHLPDRAEILEDLVSCGWIHHFDAMRREVARESRAVLDFSDECRFWAARRGDS